MMHSEHERQEETGVAVISPASTLPEGGDCQLYEDLRERESAARTM